MSRRELDKVNFEYLGLAGTISAREEREQRRYLAGRVFVWVKDETVFENLQNRTTRPTEQYKLIALSALKQAGYDIDSFKLVWSQKAGCTMCPCSPGFIMKPKTESVKWDTAFTSFSIQIERKPELLNNGTYREI